MKTIIILLVSIITSSNLLAQNVISYKTAEKDTSTTAIKLQSQLTNLTNSKKLEEEKNELINEFKDYVVKKRESDSVMLFKNLLELINNEFGITIEKNSLTKKINENKNFNILNDIVDEKYENSIDDKQKTLQTKIDSLNRQIDSISKISDKDNLSNFQWIFKGGKNQTVRKGFWSELGEPRKNMMLSLSLGDVGGTFFSEVLVDYIGPIRLSLSTAITTSKKNDTTSTTKTQNTVLTDASKNDNKESLQNFLNGGGGNVIVRFMFPLIFWSNRVDNSKPGTNTRYSGLFLSSKISGTLPILNSSINNPSGLIESSIEAQFGLLSEGKIFGLEGFFNLGGFYASPEIMNKLTREDYKNIAIYSQGCLKLTLKEEFLIYLNFPIVWLGMSNRNFAIDKTPFSISFSTFLDKQK